MGFVALESGFIVYKFLGFLSKSQLSVFQRVCRLQCGSVHLRRQDPRTDE